MKKLQKTLTAGLTVFGLVVPCYADVILNDTFADGSRAEQNLPTESAWYGNPGSGLTTSVGHMVGAPAAAGSASWTTYFTDSFASSVNLANIGDMLTVTWSFSLTNVGAANASQNFRLALVQSPNGGRISTDTTPANQVYAGYAMFGNMGVTLGRGNGDNLDLMEWASPGGANNILSTGGAYTKIAGDNSVSGNTGYQDATPYTFVFSIQRTASGLQLDQTMTGGNLNGSGGLTNSFLDTTPSTFTFDTFSLRPSNASGTAGFFDTTLVKVEFTPSVPEPSAVALAGLVAFGMVVSYRRMRR